MFGRPPGIWEIVLILVIILILFGVGKLPQVGGAIGKGLHAFKKGQRGEDDVEDEEEPTKPGRKVTKKVATRSTTKQG